MNVASYLRSSEKSCTKNMQDGNNRQSLHIIIARGERGVEQSGELSMDGRKALFERKNNRYSCKDFGL